MSAESDLFPPRYRDPEWVARGGMGDVYRATDAALGRTVAIKLLAERSASDAEVRRRFTREALAAARLSGEPSTVTIFDVGDWQGRPFIVMEYLGGGSLEEALRAGRAQPPARVLAWIEQAAVALDAAHARGVVHRDVKPANLLLDGEGCVHVADFGIATAAGLDSFTQTGTILGTAGYLAPEQAVGRPTTPASDRYALGVVAFELLAGTRPFEGESATAEATAHVQAPVPSASQRNHDMPVEADPVFRRALAKDPAQRFSSCGELVAALRAAYDEAGGTTRLLAAPTALPPPVVRRGRMAWLLPLGVLLLAGGGIAAALVVSGGSHRASTPSVHTVTAQGATVRETVTTAATPAPAATDPHTLNNQGYAQMLAGNYAAALPLLHSAVAGLQDPSDPVTAYANFNLGQTLVRLGRCADAIPYLQRAQRLEPQRHEVHDALKGAQRCAPGGGPHGKGPHGDGDHGNGNSNQGND